MRATFFRELATLISAGVPVAEAVAVLAAQTDASKPRLRLEKLSTALQSGESLPDAARRLGLLEDWEAGALSAAAKAGRTEETLAALADEHEFRARLAARFKSRMVLPAAVFTIALFVAPIPALAAGRLGVSGYLARSLLPLALIGTIAWLFGYRRRSSRTLPGHAPVAALSLRLPLVGQVIDLRARRDLLSALALLLRSGVSAHRAMPLAIEAVRNVELRKRYRFARARLDRGATVAEALRSCGVLRAGTGYEFAATGEYSGRLDEMLARYAQLLGERLDGQLEQFAEWIPRLVYFLVMGYIASHVLGFYLRYLPGL